ncbi:MAG: ABC transporter ATP-binding protein [Treponema sp.]|nr:ABC transporter ATP-binding protein [Treponema sp.]
MEPVLSVNNLCVTLYTEQGALPVVDNVSFSLDKGKTLGIVGESGCGKSMLASAIIGLVSHPGKITGGSILFEGQDLTRLSQKQLRTYRGSCMSMVFQEPMTSLNPLMTCGAQISECLRAHRSISKKEANQIALEMIESVGIHDAPTVFRQLPIQLSGGMRQRIMIAIALVCKPRLLLCDEPTTALDVTVQAQILKLIRKLQKETGAAVIFISHDMGVISEMSDSVAVMYAGKLIEYGSANDIFSNPQHPYTKALQQAIPRPDVDVAELETIPGMVPLLHQIPAGCVFAPRCRFADERCTANRPQEIPMGCRGSACFHPLGTQGAQ